jgi:hypothetical protein
MATKVVSILTGGSNNHTTSAEEVNAMYTDILSDGVVGTITNTSGVAPATGNFAVNAQGTPDMTVRVSQGVAYVTGTPTGGNSQRFRISMWSYEDVTIASNSTGGTRYDHIYVSLDADKLANPGVNGDDVATLVTSRSTSASTDNGTPPTYGYKIAVVTVANGASSITNANITDSRVQTSVSKLYDWTGLPSGSIVQIQGATNTLNGTTTTTMPADDTIPQNTEGVEVTTQAITPKSTSNTLIIEAWQVVSTPTSNSAITIALFQDSTANALAASEYFQTQSGGYVTAHVKYIMTAGTTSATTFKYRVGSNQAGTLTYGTRYSTAHTGGITITEVKA